ncbi:MAG: guanitoxin biosynthesis heme-dependent pre-guanitoxin N-hydroxylase GntA [Patiriisocius sp.]|uniref:guanitoxin biosynthesis heme-dependent pre-guanitoxin N-hydroxylase GntA n=1 Tax=Patiriisocius sp. TaxID=2822396 RepID=UPI003EF9F5BB
MKNDLSESIEHSIRAFILDDHPCIMAQSLVADENLTIKDYAIMDQETTCTKLLEDIHVYLKDVNVDGNKFQTFIATFHADSFTDEISYEAALWNLLKKLNILDPIPWDASTSSDTTSNKFSFSLLGEAFYIVGMHPESSRKARSAPFPMIVFNLHSQFELLRSVGRYKRMRNIIRRRDKELQGSINPMLEDFGKNSEARQYSGRAVEDNWKCPHKFNEAT